MSKKTDKGAFEGLDKIRLGGFLFDLRFEKEGNLRLEDVGSIDYRDEIITIFQDRKTKGELILHELVHEANRQTNLKAQEEDVVRLSYFLYSCMKDNPELIVAILNENTELNIQFPTRLVGAPLFEPSLDKEPDVFAG